MFAALGKLGESNMDFLRAIGYGSQFLQSGPLWVDYAVPLLLLWHWMNLLS